MGFISDFMGLGSILFSLILCISCGGIGRSSFGLIIKRGDFGVI